MKRTILFLSALLIGISGVWAQVTVEEMVDRGLYTISFVSYDGKKTWGLSSSGTTASVTANATGSTFVAHKYTNESGATRWIFVNNEDGYYLAHRAATQTFNISKPINEFAVSNLTKGGNVDNAADCTSKVYMVADNRYINNTYLGCYILKEANGAFDNSTAPYYNGTYTSALYLTAVEETVSVAAALAIAKFDALYAVKPYVREGRNMSVLFDANAVSAIENNINAQTTSKDANSVAETFLRSAEGKKFYAVSGSAIGQYLNIEETLVSATNTSLTAVAVMQAEYAANGKYYLKGIFNNRYICTPHQYNVAPATTSNKAEAATFYIGNYDNTTDNKVYFATSKKAAANTGVYEAIHYSTSYENRTCGWDYNAGASQWIITAVSDDEYTALANPIEQTLNYSLTDANGATYSGTYEGFLMTTVPTFTGCTGYTLTNGSWDLSTKTYSATINFPFAISSNGVDNWTYINSFDHKSGYSISDGSCFYWHANDNGEDVNVHNRDVPTNIQENEVYTDNEKYKWAVYPAISDLNITFTIKNSYTGKYIFSNKSSRSHEKGAVTLSETGTPLTYDTSSTTNCGTIYTWYIPSTSLYLSVNSVNGSIDALLGVWNLLTTHDGPSIGFYTPADFATLDANLLAACASYNTFKTGRTFGTNLGEYNGSSYESMEAAFLAATTASSLTAAQLSAHTSTLENPATKLTLNLPTANNFYRFKIGEKYMCSIAESDNVRTATSTSDDATTVFYLDNNSYLMGYSDGYGFNFGYCKATVPGIFNLFEFSESSQVGTYDIHTTAGTGDTQWSDRHITINGNKLAQGQGTWTIEEVTELPVTISAAGYATFNSPVAVEIPQGITAYQASIQDADYIRLVSIDDGVIPANFPVVLKGPAGTYTFNITTTEQTEGDYHANELKGSIAAKSVSVGEIYTLQRDSETTVGFYPNAGETFKGFSAYLTSANGSRGFQMVSSTGIEHIATPILFENAYDLQGRNAGIVKKGVYIVNGKKVLF